MNDTDISSESSRQSPAAGRENKPVVWWHWHRRLYDWVVALADSKHASAALFILSFAESSFFPVPPDVLLAPLALGAPKKWLRFAVSCSIASVFGGVLGYCIGMFLWSLIGQWVYTHLAAVGLTEANFVIFRHWYDRYDFWIVFTCGFTPLPYKVCTISAGVAQISFVGFLIASTISRSARFFIVAGLVGWKGQQVRLIIEKYFNWFSLAFAALLVGGFYIIKWLH